MKPAGDSTLLCCVIHSLGGQKVEQRERPQCKSVICSPADLHAVTWRPAQTQPAHRRSLLKGEVRYSGGLTLNFLGLKQYCICEGVWNGPGLMRTSMCVKTNPWASLHTSLLWAWRAWNEQTLPINLSIFPPPPTRTKNLVLIQIKWSPLLKCVWAPLD